MNILFLSELLYPHGSGAELATYLYAKLMSEAGLSVAVVTDRFPGEGEFWTNGNLTIYRLALCTQNRSIKYPTFTLGLMFSSFLRDMLKWADVVYVPRFWYWAIPLAKALGKPVVTHLHDYIAICPLATSYDMSEGVSCSHRGLICPPKSIYVHERTRGTPLARSIVSVGLNSTLGHYLGSLLRLSDAIVCVSEAQRRIIIERIPSLQARTTVIYNPLPELSPTEIEGDDFGYFGGQGYLKGFHTLHRAMVRLKETCDGTTTVHATRFTNCSEELAKSLKGVGVLAYGKLNSHEYEKVYGRVRAVIVPSVWQDPCPYVLLEAMITGRLVIASRVGGIPETVDASAGAVLFEAGNHEELAMAIRLVRSLDRDTVADLGAQNRETLLKRFNCETSARRLISACDRLA